MAALTPPISQFQSTSRHHSSESSSTLNGVHDFLGPYFSSRRASSESSTMAVTPLSATSKQSSSAMYQSAVGSAASVPSPAKRLRSQYPPDPNKSHVEFILVASFDIDRGSIMEHQYPGSISGDEHMLAELMLPDQVHNRSQDWTIFFLHKDSANEDDEDDQSSVRRKRHRRRKRPPEDEVDADDRGEYDDAAEDDESSEAGSSEDEEEVDSAIEGPPLIYVLNLVNTKHDPSVKRGAIVKAMAICTRHPFLHIYKPLLLLALDEYFKAPNPGTLASLYDAVNAMDLSLMPRLSLLERSILQATASKDMFVEKFQRMIDQSRADDARKDGDSPSKLHADGPSTPTARYILPRDTHDFETRIVYNGISVPVKVPTTRSPEIVGDFSIIKLIQTFSAPHVQSPQAFAQHPHLTTGGPFTHPIIVLVNALLTQKRIMFIGHNLPSGDVAEAVLAACALASGGLLRGFTRHAFPYTDLTKIDDLLKVPGFIAGVTNPAFANKPEWWDLLADLTTGRMKISTRIEPAQTTEGILSFQQQNPSALSPANQQALQTADATGDAAFMDAVTRAIANRLGEPALRAMWRDRVLKTIRVAAAFEEAVYGASALHIGGEEADAGAFGVAGHGYVWSDDSSRQRELAANVNRIEGWRNTRSYYSLIQDLANLYTSRPISSIDLHHHHDRLRSQKLSPDDSGAIYLAFERAVRSPAEVCQLLTVTSESHGGLFYVSLGLVHPKREVRFRTAELLQRITTHEAGRHFWEALGRFAKVAFLRIRREMDVGGAGGGEGDVTASGNGGGADEDGLSRATTLMEQASVGS